MAFVLKFYFQRLAAQAMCDIIKEKDLKLDYVVGVPYAAIPLATVTQAYIYPLLPFKLVSDILDIPMLMKRKDAKSYGTKQLIEVRCLASFKFKVICFI